MNVVALLAEAADLAKKMHYHVREEFLDGAGGGHCFFSGKKVLLLDVTQSAEEQLNDVLDALREESGVREHPVSDQLAQQLQLTKAA